MRKYIARSSPYKSLSTEKANSGFRKLFWSKTNSSEEHKTTSKFLFALQLDQKSNNRFSNINEKGKSSAKKLIFSKSFYISLFTPNLQNQETKTKFHGLILETHEKAVCKVSSYHYLNANLSFSSFSLIRIKKIQLCQLSHDT